MIPSPSLYTPSYGEQLTNRTGTKRKINKRRENLKTENSPPHNKFPNSSTKKTPTLTGAASSYRSPWEDIHPLLTHLQSHLSNLTAQHSDLSTKHRHLQRSCNSLDSRVGHLEAWRERTEERICIMERESVPTAQSTGALSHGRDSNTRTRAHHHEDFSNPPGTGKKYHAWNEFSEDSPFNGAAASTQQPSNNNTAVLTNLFHQWKHQIESKLEKQMEQKLKQMEQQLSLRMEHFVHKLVERQLESHSQQQQHRTHAPHASTLNATAESLDNTMDRSLKMKGDVSTQYLLHKLKALKKKHRKLKESTSSQIKSLQESVHRMEGRIGMGGTIATPAAGEPTNFSPSTVTMSHQQESLLHNQSIATAPPSQQVTSQHIDTLNDKIKSLKRKMEQMHSDYDLRYQQKDAQLEYKFNALQQNLSNETRDKLDQLLKHDYYSSTFVDLTNKVEDRLQKQMHMNMQQTNDHIMQLYREQEADAKLAIKQLIEKNKEFLVRTAAALKKRTMRSSSKSHKYRSPSTRRLSAARRQSSRHHATSRTTPKKHSTRTAELPIHAEISDSEASDM